MFNENRLVTRKRYVSGGGIDHTLMKWINGVLTKVVPKKVGGTVRYYPLPHKPNLGSMMDKATVASGWDIPVKKVLQADAFSQPSGFDRNAVLNAINSAMGSGVSRPSKLLRRLR